MIGLGDVNFGTFLRLFSPPPNTDIIGRTISGSSGGKPNNVDLVEGSSGVIFQSFATTPGNVYDLSFEYGNNPNGAGGSINVLVTGIGTLLSQNVSHNSPTVANMDYKLFSQTFIANSAITTLQHRDCNPCSRTFQSRSTGRGNWAPRISQKMVVFNFSALNDQQNTKSGR